mgnify:FL=1|jgi:hypothetical protein
MSSQNYNGQVYGLYIENESVFKEYLDERNRNMEDLRDDLLDYGAVFIDEDFEDVTIESAIDNSTFDYANKPFENVWILPLDHWPTLLKPAYNSEDEIITELKNKYSPILPKDFDYHNNIVYATYVVWG